jgi:hypothetical protein
MQMINAEADSNHAADWCSQTLDQHIGVRIPGGSQIFSAISTLSRWHSFFGDFARISSPT